MTRTRPLALLPLQNPLTAPPAVAAAAAVTRRARTRPKTPRTVISLFPSMTLCATGLPNHPPLPRTRILLPKSTMAFPSHSLPTTTYGWFHRIPQHLPTTHTTIHNRMCCCLDSHINLSSISADPVCQLASPSVSQLFIYIPPFCFCINCV